MREYLTALRALLAGEQVTVTGDHVVLDGVRLDWPPTTTLPVLMGAVGPKSLALAGECADGVLLDGDLTVQGVRDSLAICRGARDAAGVTTPFASAVYQRYYRGADATAQLARETRPTAIAAGLVADGADGADIAAHARELLGAGVGTVVFMPSATDPDPIGYLAEIAHAAQRA
jgi:alkanesulfonate monooxygenase SsuD/methylene tetrahydromethanopterin reductase-like flavin-dependent oxidoreductase (luciferase family)